MRLLELLKRIECGTEQLCPECGAVCPDDARFGHEMGCELKTAIDHFAEVAKIPEAERTIENVRFPK